MKLMIDISAEDFERVKCGRGAVSMMRKAIIHGTPLPKGHGSLKDADAIRKTIRESIEECRKWANEVKGSEMYARVSQALGTFVECSLRIKNAPTIIEADKAGE